jgi:O-antigen/teichoic acid export membrane protein
LTSKLSQPPDSSHVQIAQRSVRGSLVLFVGNFLQTLVSAIGVIIVARLLGPGNYGVYTLSLVIPGLIQLFLGLGVNVAVTRYAAYYLSVGKPEEARRFSRNAVLFLTTFGLLLTAINYAAAGVLSSQLLHRQEIAQFVQVASVVILGQAVFQASTAALIGWNSMKLVSASQAVQAILKMGLSVGLVLTGFGVMGAVLGQAASFLLAGALAASALYVMRLRGPQGGLKTFARDIREMIRYGLPLFAGSLISGLASSYLFVILAAIASNNVVGYYGTASYITSPIGLLSSAIGSTLLPAFASLDGTGGDLAAGLRYAVKYVAYVVTPVVAFLIPAAAVLFDLLLTTTYSSGVIYLQLFAVANLPIVLGSSVLPVFLAGIGRTRLAMYATTSGAVVLLVFAPLFGFASGFGVPGLIYASLLSNLTSVVVGLALAARYMHVAIDYRSASGVFAASLVALVLTSPIALLPAPEVVILIAQMLVFLAVYLTAVPLLRGINHDDIARLEAVVIGFGPLAVLVRPLLRFERGILELV